MSQTSHPASVSSRALLRWAADCFQAARAFHLACRIAALLLVVAFAALAWLWIAGVPDRVTRTLLARMENDRCRIDVERLWLDPIEGLKARNLSMTPVDRQKAGPLAASEVLINIRWLNVLAGGPWLEAMTLRGGTATVRLPREFATDGQPRDFTVSNVTARLASSWGMLRIEKISAQWPGGTIEGQGIVVPSEPRPRAKKDARRRSTLVDGWIGIQQSLRESPSWAAELYQHLADIETTDPIKIRFDFHRHERAPELNDIVLGVEGGTAVCRGLHVDGWNIDTSLAGGVLQLPRIELRAEGRVCRLDGTFALTNRTLSLHAVNQLPPSYWCDLLPPAWIAMLTRTPLELRGALHSEIWIPATTLADFGNRWRGTISWSEAEYRGIVFRDGRLDVVRDDHSFAVSNFSAHASRDGKSGSIAGDVHIDLPSSTVEGRAHARLDPHIFSPWLSHGTQKFIDHFEFTDTPPSFEGSFRSAGSTNTTLVFSGDLSGTNLLFGGVRLSSLQTTVAHSNGHTTLSPFAFASDRGTVRGRIDVSSAGATDGQLDARIDPHIFAPLLHGSVTSFIGRFEFPRDLPTFVGSFHSPAGTNHDLTICGRLCGTNFTYRDVDILTMQTFIGYTNSQLALAPFDYTRTNGAVTGRMDLDLHNNVYSFDLSGTTDPMSIGQIVASNLLHAIAIGRYDGPTRIHAAGTYDIHNPGHTDVRVDVEAERVALRWLTADRATFTICNRGLLYEATNIAVKAFGGDIAARFFLHVATNKGGERFELELAVTSNDVRAIAQAMHPDAKDPPTGLLDLKLQLAGLLNDPTKRSLQGDGRVNIRDGQIHKIRVFGLLSSLLSKLSPDLGYATQDAMRMTFDIRDGTLSTTDLELTGLWMSAKGKGTYAIGDDRLDLLAEAQLFKRGTVVSDAVRLLTLPVMKLFQIRLTGTLANPEWQTANLPKIF